MIAKQTARGVYPAAPTYFLELIDGGLTSKPTVDSLNIMDGRIFGSSRKRIGYVETGGIPTVTAQPKSMGAVFAWGWGNSSPAGGADPYAQTIIPPTTLSGFPFITGWQKKLGEWTVFHDLQIIGLDCEVSVDAKHMRLKPNFVGMAKEQACAAPSPATEETDIVHWLDAGGYHVFSGDYAHIYHGALPTDLTTGIAAANALKAQYNLHCAVATGLHHKAADATNTITAADAATLEAELVTLCAEMRTDYAAHRVLTTTHYFADTTNVVAHAAPTTTATCLTFLAEFIGAVNSPGTYNRHLGAVANVRRMLLSFNMNASPIQGEGVTAYAIQRKPGTITIAVDQLQEDTRLINFAKFGKPVPVAGDEITTEIQTLGFTTKFIANTTGLERSIKIDVPQFDLDPEPLMSLMGNTEGTEPIITIGGEATGTAPIATVTITGEVSAY
jgi:hypothetical protein